MLLQKETKVEDIMMACRAMKVVAMEFFPVAMGFFSSIMGGGFIIDIMWTMIIIVVFFTLFVSSIMKYLHFWTMM